MTFVWDIRINTICLAQHKWFDHHAESVVFFWLSVYHWQFFAWCLPHNFTYLISHPVLTANFQYIVQIVFQFRMLLMQIVDNNTKIQNNKHSEQLSGIILEFERQWNKQTIVTIVTDHFTIKNIITISKFWM